LRVVAGSAAGLENRIAAETETKRVDRDLKRFARIVDSLGGDRRLPAANPKSKHTLESLVPGYAEIFMERANAGFDGAIVNALLGTY